MIRFRPGYARSRWPCAERRFRLSSATLASSLGEERIQIHRKFRNGRAAQPSAWTVDGTIGKLVARGSAVYFYLLLRPKHQPTFFHAGAGVSAEFRAIVFVAGDADF